MLAVHVFGRHVEAIDWKKNQFADVETQRLGGMAKGLLVAIQENATIFSIGTGASEKDGKKESEYTRDYALEHLHLLATLPQFSGIDMKRCEQILKNAYCETTSQNTAQEILAIGRHYVAQHVEQVIAVTCPTHAPRCMRELWEGWMSPEFNGLRQHFSLVAADVPFTGTSPKDVAILEPPHRGDDTSPPFYQLIPRIFKLSIDQKTDFYQKLTELLDTYIAR